MTTAVQYAAPACVAAGVVAAVLTMLATGRARLAAGIALDFWLAAGLLRLGRVPGWEPLLATALIIVIRHLAGRALLPASGLRPAAPSPPPRTANRPPGRVR